MYYRHLGSLCIIVLSIFRKYIIKKIIGRKAKKFKIMFSGVHCTQITKYENEHLNSIFENFENFKNLSIFSSSHINHRYLRIIIIYYMWTIFSFFFFMTPYSLLIIIIMSEISQIK